MMPMFYKMVGLRTILNSGARTTVSITYRKCFCKGHGLEPVLRNQEEKVDKNRERKFEGLYEEEKE